MSYFFITLSPWFGYLFLAWIFTSLYIGVKQSWFQFSDSASSFPFSFKQFIFSTVQLFCAFSIFIFSYHVAHSLIGGFSFFLSYSFHERTAIEQLIGIVLASLGIYTFLSFLSPDSLSIAMGQKGDWKKWWKGAFYGLLFYPLISSAAWIAGIIVSWFLPGPRTPQTVLTFLLSFDHSSVLFWLLFVSIVFLVPYIEEMLFRGFLQGFLGGIFHPVLAVVGTSLIFSLFHYSSLQKSSNFEIMFGLFVFSLLVSRLRVKENSVISCVGMHAAFNAISLVLSFV